jgi:glycosyltransferase involved in cell wall biosynthesis
VAHHHGLKVIHVITRLSLGGSSENTVLSVVGLAAAGHDCLLVTGPAGTETDLVAAAARRGCRVRLLPSLVREVAPVTDLRAVVDLVRIFRRERPDLVHTHTSKAGFVGRLAARLARVPLTVHTPHGHVFYAYYGPARTRLFIALERLAARWTDRIVVLTPRGAEEHLARGIGRPGQYVAIPSGVDVAALRARAPERAAARARIGVNAEAPLVVGVGRLVPVKGFDVLIAAVPELRAAFPSVSVLLVGDGPERPALEARARALGVDAHLRIVGALDDVAPCIAASDVLVAPSRNEGMGRVLIEAMALDVPVVATRVGGIPSVLGDGEFGVLVPAEAPGPLAAALIDVLHDGGRRAKLTESGRRRAEAFSVDVMVARIRELYEGLGRRVHAERRA